MKALQLISVCFLLDLYPVNGDHTLQFQFHRYSNPSHLDANGDCCDFDCQPCETLFQVLCARNGGTSHSQTGQCLSGTSHTPGSVGGDVIQFGSSIGSLSNPFTYTISGNIPQMGYQLYLEVYDDDNVFNNDFIDRIVINVPGNPLSLQSQTVTGVSNRVSLIFSYTLSCSQHFYGPDCSVYCIPYSDAQNGYYTCNSTTGAKICRDGWQNPANNCTEVACHLVCQSPGGQCIANDTCHCSTGWSGQQCDIPQCTEGCHPQGGYCQVPNECICRDNWNGTLCNISLCATNCSSVGGHCTVPEVCTCFPGYTGEACDIDLLPCDHQMPCHNGGNCSHTSNTGEYSCSCQTGYTGITCQTDVDECSVNPCHNNGTCINREPGSFECICATGWTGNVCEDLIDYCQSNPCMNNGLCTNLMTGHYCQCSIKFEGLNCELLVNPCVPNPCQNNGTCTNMITNYTCTCTEGYSGINCETVNSVTVVSDQTSPSPTYTITLSLPPASPAIIYPIVGAVIGFLAMVFCISVLVGIVLVYFKRRQAVSIEKPMLMLTQDNQFNHIPPSTGSVVLLGVSDHISTRETYRGLCFVEPEPNPAYGLLDMTDKGPAGKYMYLEVEPNPAYGYSEHVTEAIDYDYI